MKKLTILSVLIISFSFCRSQDSNEMQNTDSNLHKGFFLSIGCGPNFSGISTEVQNLSEVSYNGTGAVIDLKIGGAIQENLILHATFISNSTSNPAIWLNGHSQNTSTSLSIGETLIGGGLTHYIMPSNILLSGSLGLGNFKFMNSDAGTSGSTDIGFGLQLKAGKEWWISKGLGLGVALTYEKINLTNNPYVGVEELMKSSNIGIHFNATLN